MTDKPLGHPFDGGGAATEGNKMAYQPKTEWTQIKRRMWQARSRIRADVEIGFRDGNYCIWVPQHGTPVRRLIGQNADLEEAITEARRTLEVA